MRKLLLFTLVLILVGCSHPKHGKIVKMQDGSLYRLRASAADQSYTLELLNVAEIDSLRK